MEQLQANKALVTVLNTGKKENLFPYWFLFVGPKYQVLQLHTKAANSTMLVLGMGFTHNGGHMMFLHLTSLGGALH